MRLSTICAVILLGVGCDPEPEVGFPKSSGGGGSGDDVDGDGFDADEDCDDLDARAAPGEPEHCDLIDNDCDGVIDEGEAEGASEWFLDADNDGFGSEQDSARACEAPAQHTGVSGDCDDEDPLTHPGAREVCNEDDDDCDDVVDETLSAHQTLASVHAGLREIIALEVDPTTSRTLSTIEERLTPYEFSSLATDDNGVVYAYDVSESHLYVLEPCEGTGRGVGPVNAGALCGMTFGPDGLLYGLDADNDQLVVVSTEDGSTEVVGPLGIDIDDCGLAYSCEKNRLFGAELPGKTVFWLNMNTGIVTEPVNVDVPFETVGLVHDPDNHRLIAGTGTQLYAVDDQTFEARLVGGLQDSDDLAWIPECGF